MITSQQFIQFKAFARQDGALMGALWVLSFGCFVLSQSQPYMSLLFDLTLVCIPYAAATQVSRYRDMVLDGTISFRRAFYYALLIFFYATLILAIGQWAYFEFIDKGRMVTGMMATINSDDFKPVLEAYKMTREEVSQQMQILTETRPIDFALTFMSVNIILSFVMAWIVALFTKRTRK